MALIHTMGDASAGRLETLAAEQRRLLAERRRVQADIVKEGKKRKRLMEKARSLSDADLLSVIASRAQAKAQAKTKAKAKAKAKE